MTRTRVLMMVVVSLVAAILAFNVHLGFRNGTFDNDPCPKWDWLRFESTVIDCIR